MLKGCVVCQEQKQVLSSLDCSFWLLRCVRLAMGQKTDWYLPDWFQLLAFL